MALPAWANTMAFPVMPFLPVALAAAVILLLYRVSEIGRRGSKLPPGPPTVPVLGNAHQLPPSGAHKIFRDWAAQYGSVFSLKLGSLTTIVLCDPKAIYNLFVEQGIKYSSRPPNYVTHAVTKNISVSMSEDNKNWREQRKIISHYLTPKRLDEKHFKVQEAEATILMNGLLDQPDDFYREIKRYTSSVIASLVFGWRAPTYDSFFSRGSYEVVEKFAQVMEPGSVPPVDAFPWLRWIPEAFAPWKKRVLEVRHSLLSHWGEARRRLDERRASGVRRDCVADNLLDEWSKKKWPITDEAFTYVLAEFVTAGSDTTASQLLTLILALAKDPSIQKKAQAEIDAVCGTARTPAWTDFKQIPFINCIIKEGMRWRPTALNGLPHATKQDGEYNGMLIPKNSMIFLPIWALHHTEALYEDHETFNPDRYLGHPKPANDYAGNSDWKNRDHWGYGAGRRICPGIHLAERNMWRIIAKLLWAFDFAEPIDPTTGEIMALDTEAYTTGHLVAPKPFKVRIQPRSAEHIAVIRRERDAALEFLKQYDE